MKSTSMSSTFTASLCPEIHNLRFVLLDSCGDTTWIKVIRHAVNPKSKRMRRCLLRTGTCNTSPPGEHTARGGRTWWRWGKWLNQGAEGHLLWSPWSGHGEEWLKTNNHIRQKGIKKSDSEKSEEEKEESRDEEQSRHERQNKEKRRFAVEATI